MGLDSYMFTAEVEKDADGIIFSYSEKSEIGYWRKCWFIQEFLANEYHDTINPTDTDFNGTVMELNLDTLERLHFEMCKEANEQHSSFEEIEYYDIVDTNDINGLKKVIKFLKENPLETVYYMGSY